MSSNCPLTLTRKAQDFIKKAADKRNIPSTKPLRVKQRVVNEEVHFDLWHDENIKGGEKVYNVGELHVLLDNDTAFQLIGSTLDVLDDGSLKFTHLELPELDMGAPN